MSTDKDLEPISAPPLIVVERTPPKGRHIKRELLQYHFEVIEEDRGFWAQCVEFKGCFTQAKTMEQLRLNAKKALNLYLDEGKACGTT